jgi:hypothetical protein
MEQIKMARGLALPRDAVTQTFGFVGRKGSGKSYSASKFAEGLHSIRAPFVVIDPVGTWYGLRLAADGKKPGLPIPVLGGEHGDLPLAATAGAVVARFIIDNSVSAVLDVSGFRKSERKRFVADFAEDLFHRAKKVRSPLMVIFEEAQVFAPQRCGKGEERMLGAVEDIVRLGRNYGLGSALITQRPQSVNKEVLNQVECLFVGQLNGAHERKAIDQWIVQNVASDVTNLVQELPSLPVGDMMVWSPQWLGVFKQVHITKKHTYDASATPKLGARRIVRKLAEVDIGALKTSMEDTVEEAKQSDPKELKKRIRKLERDLVAAGESTVTKEVPAVTDEMLSDVTKLVTELRGIRDNFVDLADQLDVKLNVVQSAVDSTKIGSAAEFQRKLLPKHDKRTRGQTSPTVVNTELRDSSNGSLPKAQRMLLTVLAQNAPRRLSNKQTAVMAGYSPKSSTVFNSLGALRTKGYIEGANASMTITDDGKMALGPVHALAIGAQLAEAWYGKLGKAERSLLRVIVDRYPDRLDKDDAAGLAGYSNTSSTVFNALGKLRSLCLIEGSNAGMVASETLIN